MADRKREEDAMIRRYASVLRVCMWIGLLIVLVFGVLYLMNINPANDVDLVLEHWDRPSQTFWQALRGGYADGYSWFLDSLPAMDSLSIMGILLLATAPLIALIFIIFRMRGIYLLLITILIAGYLFSIFRPFL